MDVDDWPGPIGELRGASLPLAMDEQQVGWLRWPLPSAVGANARRWLASWRCPSGRVAEWPFGQKQTGAEERRSIKLMNRQRSLAAVCGPVCAPVEGNYARLWHWNGIGPSSFGPLCARGSGSFARRTQNAPQTLIGNAEQPKGAQRSEKQGKAVPTLGLLLYCRLCTADCVCCSWPCSCTFLLCYQLSSSLSFASPPKQLLSNSSNNTKHQTGHNFLPAKGP